MLFGAMITSIIFISTPLLHHHQIIDRSPYDQILYTGPITATKSRY